MQHPEFFIGLDLGQSHDFTALVILERLYEPTTEVDDPLQGTVKTVLRYHLRHLERPELGTPYPAIVQRVRSLMAQPELTTVRKEKNGHQIVKHPVPPTLVVDKTGVGAPVVDLFKQVKLNPVAVTITGGNEQHRDGMDFSVPKRDLVSSLSVAFQNGTLKVAQSLPLADVLVNELLNFKAKINLKTAHDSYEAWRENIHDDLVLATALALWWGESKHRGGVTVGKVLGF